ncbi:MAG TPA: hypothetical protein PKV71_00345 [Calditrichia bacterium]|nr:hypothetical protein [Calditrichota bacterium]HQV30288.1 hypothetical protein [Calditrichia bacterium]
MLTKSSKPRLGVVKKTEILMALLHGGNFQEHLKKLSAPQLQDLRNFLEKQLIHLSAKADGEQLTLTDIKGHLEPIPNYYYKQDCREPMDACFNETCLASNPSCFSRKMNGQIEVLLNLLKPNLSET